MVFYCICIAFSLLLGIAIWIYCTHHYNELQLILLFLLLFVLQLLILLLFVLQLLILLLFIFKARIHIFHSHYLIVPDCNTARQWQSRDVALSVDNEGNRVPFSSLPKQPWDMKMNSNNKLRSMSNVTTLRSHHMTK